MLTKPLDLIAEPDISDLVTSQVPESHTLDYKRDLPSRDSARRHEFCSDVSAMANANGGDLILGIEEDPESRAARVVPSSANPDDEQLRLQDLLLNGLEPRVTGVQVRPVPYGAGHVYVVRIPQSWARPHRTRTNQHFYLREGARKRQLDIPEIRIAFNDSEATAERLRTFRADRVGKILTGDLPVRLSRGAICVFHVFPVLPTPRRDVVNPLRYESEWRLPILGPTGGGFRINLDGAVSFYGDPSSCDSYAIFFRTGHLEAVRVFGNPLDSGNFNIPSQAFEQEIIKFFRSMSAEMHQLELGPPYVVAFSILGAKGAELGISKIEKFFARGDAGTFDREVVLVPDILVSDTADAGVALKAMFDLIWQAAGYAGSMNYKEDGTWGRPRQ